MSYIKTQFNEKEFSLIDVVNDLIIDLDTLSVNKSKVLCADIKFTVEEKRVISDKNEILAYFEVLVSSVPDGETCEVKIISDSVDERMVSLIEHLLRIRSKVNLSLVIFLEKSKEKDAMARNVKRIHSLIPLFSYPYHIDIRYIYEQKNCGTDSFSLCCIIGSNVISVCDNQLAICYDEPQIVDLYKAQFEQIYFASRVLVKFGDVFGHIELLKKYKSEKVNYALQSICCVYKYLSTDCVNKYLNPEIQQREEIIGKVKEYMLNLQSKEYNIKTFFSLGGLKIFLMSGECNDLPNNVARSLEMDDSIKMLENLVASLKKCDGNNDCILKENLLKFS